MRRIAFLLAGVATVASVVTSAAGKGSRPCLHPVRTLVLVLTRMGKCPGWFPGLCFELLQSLSCDRFFGSAGDFGFGA